MTKILYIKEKPAFRDEKKKLYMCCSFIESIDIKKINDVK